MVDDGKYDMFVVKQIAPWAMVCGGIFSFYYALIAWGGEYPMLVVAYNNLSSWLMAFAFVGILYQFVGVAHRSFCVRKGMKNVKLSPWAQFGHNVFIFSIFCIIINIFWDMDYVRGLSEGGNIMYHLQSVALGVCAVCGAVIIGCVYMYLYEMALAHSRVREI